MITISFQWITLTSSFHELHNRKRRKECLRCLLKDLQEIIMKDANGQPIKFTISDELKRSLDEEDNRISKEIDEKVFKQVDDMAWELSDEEIEELDKEDTNKGECIKIFYRDYCDSLICARNFLYIYL